MCSTVVWSTLCCLEQLFKTVSLEIDFSKFFPICCKVGPVEACILISDPFIEQCSLCPQQFSAL